MEKLGGLDSKYDEVFDLLGEGSTESLRSSSSSSSEASDAWTELTLPADWCDGLEQGEVGQLDDSTMGLPALAFLDEQHFTEHSGAEHDDVLLFQDVLPDSSVDFWCDGADGGGGGVRKRGRPPAHKGGSQAARASAPAPARATNPSKHPSTPQSKQSKHTPGRPLGRPLVRMGPDGPIRSGPPHPPRPPPNMSAARPPVPPGGFKTPPMLQQRQLSVGDKRPREPMPVANGSANGARPVVPGPPRQMAPGMVKMYKHQPGSPGARAPMPPGVFVQGPAAPRPTQKKMMVWKTPVALPSRSNGPLLTSIPTRPMANPTTRPAVEGSFLK